MEAESLERRALIYVASYSGLRAEELWALRRSKLTLPVGQIGKIQVHAPQSEPRGRIVIKATKTYRRREVPIPPTVARVLREHLLAYRPRTNWLRLRWAWLWSV